MSESALAMLTIFIGVAIVVVPLAIISLYQDYREKHQSSKDEMLKH
ncbi:MAG: hypothetical protein AB1414_16940 [bacterium]